MEEKKVRKKFFIFLIALTLLALIISLCLTLYLRHSIDNTSILGKIDDWEYDPDKYNSSEGSIISWGSSGGSSSGSSGWTPQANSSAAGSSGSSFSLVSPNSSASADTNIGFSTGGAKDVNNFRENIKEGYFPISTDITYNGLFYDYTFDTGNSTTNQEDLFYPSYSTAISKDPVSEKDEYYMTVGLNSNIKEEDFQRKKLNLVVVLDISGSMSSPFNSYYYDNNENEDKDEDSNKTKMEIANESVNILIDQLKEDDRFGMVLFESSAYKAKPLNLVRDVDMEAIKEHVLDIEAIGGTNFEAGYSEATKLFEDFENVDTNEYENRIIVLTDAMPNTGKTSDKSLLSMVEKNSNNKIYTTFIGIGVDFNTELIETISDVRGANYYSVHNSKEFKERMGEQFEYMVTPLVFDLKLDMQSDSYEISGIYGSDTVNKETGNIMNVNTLFPSKTTSDGEVKGGVILLKLSKKENSNSESSDIVLNVSYKDRNGEEYQNSQTVTFTSEDPYYDNTGIRKAIVLTRYANLIKDWILYERSDNDSRFLITPNSGIIDCIYTEDEIYRMLGEHERTSTKLSVSSEYKKLFSTLKSYIESEKNEIKDDTLSQEIEILDILTK